MPWIVAFQLFVLISLFYFSYWGSLQMKVLLPNAEVFLSLPVSRVLRSLEQLLAALAISLCFKHRIVHWFRDFTDVSGFIQCLNWPIRLLSVIPTFSFTFPLSHSDPEWIVVCQAITNLKCLGPTPASFWTLPAPFFFHSRPPVCFSLIYQVFLRPWSMFP